MSQIVKIGIFATIVLLLLGYFILKIEDLDLFGPEGRDVHALFDSVAGLDDRSAVRVAGVRVGRVDGITLEGRQARVRLLLEQPLGLTEGTYAEISNMGLLGDKYVELVPGPPGARPLPDGAVIPGITPPGFDEAMAKLNQVADSIIGVTDPLGSTLTGTGQPTPLSRLIDNMEATTAEIRLLVETNRAQLEGTIRNFERVSETLADNLPALVARLDGILVEVDAVVAENRGAVGETAQNMAALTRELQGTVDDLNQVTGRLARGEGTLGKLLTSDEAHQELVATMDAVQGGVGQLSDTLGRVQRLRLDVDLQGFVLADAAEDESSAYGSFGAIIDPGEDTRRLYRVGIAKTPRGDSRTKTETITVTRPDGTTQTTVIDTLTEEDEPVLSALVGYRLQNEARVWTGLIEDDFGVQVEYPFLDRRLWLDVKAFDFNRRENRDPHLRVMGRYHLTPSIYLLGGYDDPLESELDSLFVGGGITWTDETLKYLLGSVPLG
ncbi:MAG TPA: MlaD family protein [Thermoanaerobaculia bacterium]|nr:MlaD family protein [Thermoanaerobaculia bacterium]